MRERSVLAIIYSTELRQILADFQNSKSRWEEWWRTSVEAVEQIRDQVGLLCINIIMSINIRPPVRSNGRTYKMLVMFFFFFQHQISELPRPIDVKLCHTIGIWLGRPERSVPDGLLFYRRCFFRQPHLRGPEADRRETLSHDRNLARIAG